MTQIVPSLAIVSSFSWLLCLFGISLFCVLFNSSVSSCTRCSRFILDILCLYSKISHLSRTFSLFCWRMVSETKNWALDHIIFWWKSPSLFNKYIDYCTLWWIQYFRLIFLTRYPRAATSKCQCSLLKQLWADKDQLYFGLSQTTQHGQSCP